MKKKTDESSSGKKRRSPTAAATVEKVVDGTRFKFTITPPPRTRKGSKEVSVAQRENGQDEDFIQTTEIVREQPSIGYSGQKVSVEIPDLRTDIVIVRWNPLNGDYDYWVRVQNLSGELLLSTDYTQRTVVQVPTRNLQRHLGKGVQVTVFCIHNLTGDYSMVGSDWFIVPKYNVVDFEDMQFPAQNTQEEMSLVQKFYYGLGLAALLAFLFILFRVH